MTNFNKVNRQLMSFLVYLLSKTRRCLLDDLAIAEITTVEFYCKLIIGLIFFGIDVAPLLAGAGLLRVALSLASQNLIKDTINGFLIVLEDQYGIGDIIDTGTWSGTVEGLNLRITQLRNSEGKLITIPNSQMGAVANLTKSWSRVDLNVLVAYDTDIKAAMKIMETTAVEMSLEPKWRWQITEPPQIKGIDDFSDRGLLVKIWALFKNGIFWVTNAGKIKPSFDFAYRTKVLLWNLTFQAR